MLISEAGKPFRGVQEVIYMMDTSVMEDLNLNMDTSEPTECKNDYFCALCNYRCATPALLEYHFSKISHAKVEEAIEHYGSSRLLVEAEEEQEENMNNAQNFQLTPIHTYNVRLGPMLNPPGNTLEEMLDVCKATEPALGLEFIYEYHPDKEGNCMFDCTLCNFKTVLKSMFRHIIGDKHKIAYISIHHPEEGITNKYKVNTVPAYKRLKEVAFRIENAEGRKKTNVSMSTYDPQYLTGEYLCRSCILLRKAYAPDEPTRIEKSVLDYQHKSFQELKADYEEQQRKAEARGEAAEAGSGELKFSERDPVQIFYNEELFNYLKMFHTVNDDNLLFVIKMVENLSKALERHKPGNNTYIFTRTMANMFQRKCQEEMEMLAAQQSSKTSHSNDEGSGRNVQQGSSRNSPQRSGRNSPRNFGRNVPQQSSANAPWQSGRYSQHSDYIDRPAVSQWSNVSGQSSDCTST
ncbi:uncharacterized protein LOC128660486 [Bombina bombina]|uniref:uncharacterized protein LOC128660486 n=1 Tax=Bombina bombina TaxID=8345 RepID=UPI00235ACF07|nr:uncharacterized protein LOC128660486 [Bombina bombina]XP_053570336.1 uncharacterized protein LOC128660486 [Bombina bombina]